MRHRRDDAWDVVRHSLSRSARPSVVSEVFAFADFVKKERELQGIRREAVACHALSCARAGLSSRRAVESSLLGLKSQNVAFNLQDVRQSFFS